MLTWAHLQVTGETNVGGANKHATGHGEAASFPVGILPVGHSCLVPVDVNLATSRLLVGPQKGGRALCHPATGTSDVIVAPTHFLLQVNADVRETVMTFVTSRSTNQA